MINKIAFVAIFFLITSMTLSANITPIQAQTDLEIEPKTSESDSINPQIEKESDEVKKESDEVKKESDEVKKESDEVKKERDESRTEPKPLPRVSNPNSVLKIALIASEQIARQLDAMENVPENTEKLYDQGLRELELLKDAISNKDRVATEKQFLSTMKIFRQVTNLLADKPNAEVSSLRAVPQPDLQSNYDRMEKYLVSLKAIADRHNAEIDFTTIDELMDLTQNQIDENDYDEAKKSMDKLQRIILDINKMLREKATQKTVEKAKSFAQKYLNVLEKLTSQAKELGYSEEIIIKLEEQKEKLSTIENPDDIVKEIRNILTVKEQVELSRSDMIKSRVNQLGEKIESLSNVDSTKLDQLKSDLARLKELIVEKNYEDAQKLLRELTDQLKEL